MKCLIIKTSSLGDILHAFPTLDYLIQKFPGITIDWVVEKGNASLVKAHPQIHRVLEVDTKKWRKEFKSLPEITRFKKELQQERYDFVFDLQGNIKSGLILYLAKAKKKVGFGFKTAPEWPNCLFTNSRINPPSGLNIREELLFILQSTFNDFSAVENRETQRGVTHSILVALGSAWPNKRASLETMIELLKQLQGPFLFSWGTEDERECAQKVASHFPDAVILEKLSLPQLQTLMKEVSLVIAMDSLPLHLAATTNTPTFALFGPSNPLKYNPPGEKHLFFQGRCTLNKQFEKRCPHLRTCKVATCLANLPQEEIERLGVELRNIQKLTD